MRKPGEPPAFDRIMKEVREAQCHWELGNRGISERTLRMVASIAYAESQELDPKDPFPENIRRR